LVVSDTASLTSTDTAVITVNNLPPTAVISAPLAAAGGISITFSGAPSSDPGGGVLQFAWDLDDDADFDDSAAEDASRSFTYLGTYTVWLRVEDSFSESNIISHTIQITSNASNAYSTFLPVIFK
jgi:hypothetical protein